MKNLIIGYMLGAWSGPFLKKVGERFVLQLHKRVMAKEAVAEEKKA